MVIIIFHNNCLANKKSILVFKNAFFQFFHMMFSKNGIFNSQSTNFIKQGEIESNFSNTSTGVLKLNHLA